MAQGPLTLHTQLHLEGPNGGRKVQGNLNAPWRCVEFPGVLPTVTIGTEHGAVTVTVSSDGRSVEVATQRWRMSDDAPINGVSRTLYNGPIGKDGGT